jgi:lysyl-tRNA synthetase class 2
MTRIDVEKAQKALNRVPGPANRAGRFNLRSHMLPVTSSMMTAIDYDEETKELDITFIGGRKYRYFNVPFEVYHGLANASSKGQFFNVRIKDAFHFSAIVPRP